MIKTIFGPPGGLFGPPGAPLRCFHHVSSTEITHLGLRNNPWNFHACRQICSVCPLAHLVKTLHDERSRVRVDTKFDPLGGLYKNEFFSLKMAWDVLLLMKFDKSFVAFTNFWNDPSTNYPRYRMRKYIWYCCKILSSQFTDDFLRGIQNDWIFSHFRT